MTLSQKSFRYIRMYSRLSYRYQSQRSQLVTVSTCVYMLIYRLRSFADGTDEFKVDEEEVPSHWNLTQGLSMVFELASRW